MGLGHEGTGEALGISHPVLGFVIFGVFATIWTLWFTSQKELNFDKKGRVSSVHSPATACCLMPPGPLTCYCLLLRSTMRRMPGFKLTRWPEYKVVGTHADLIDCLSTRWQASFGAIMAGLTCAALYSVLLASWQMVYTYTVYRSVVHLVCSPPPSYIHHK